MTFRFEWFFLNRNLEDTGYGLGTIYTPFLEALVEQILHCVKHSCECYFRMVALELHCTTEQRVFHWINFIYNPMMGKNYILALQSLRLLVLISLNCLNWTIGISGFHFQRKTWTSKACDVRNGDWLFACLQNFNRWKSWRFKFYKNGHRTFSSQMKGKVWLTLELWRFMSKKVLGSKLCITIMHSLHNNLCFKTVLPEKKNENLVNFFCDATLKMLKYRDKILVIRLSPSLSLFH